MTTTKSEIKSLKPGRFCVIDNEPCKVLSMTTSVSGKHGAAKARLEAVGLFDNKKRSIVKPADTEIDVPIVDKRIGQVLSISGNTAQIMDMTTYETFDAVIPEEVKNDIKEGKEVIYWVIMERKMIMQVK